MIFYFSALIISVLTSKLKGDSELKEKTKVKAWKDIDKVIKASSVPRKLKWYEREMIVVPKGRSLSD